MKHTLSVLVENSPGVLSRVSGLFTRRGYNIESLNVGVTENPAVSRMTIVVRGSPAVVEQVSKQLNKLINVLKVSDITSEEIVSRELALIKVSATPAQRASILQIVSVFRGQVVDATSRSVIVELTGDEEKIDAFIQLVREFGIKEVVRTGRVAMMRGLRNQREEKGEDNIDESLLRWRRRLEIAKKQAHSGAGVWEPRPCASAESKG
ncbi:MAG: acetolactate synthase small subunit [Bacillota bacterium]